MPDEEKKEEKKEKEVGKFDKREPLETKKKEPLPATLKAENGELKIQVEELAKQFKEQEETIDKLKKERKSLIEKHKEEKEALEVVIKNATDRIKELEVDLPGPEDE